MLHISAPARVTDRTAFIVSGGDTPGHPGEELAELVIEAAQATRERHPSRRIIIGVPCMTFHARMIFDGFERKLAEAFGDDRGSKLVLINLIDSVCATFAADEDIRRICVLGTHGTVKAARSSPLSLRVGLTQPCRTTRRSRSCTRPSTTRRGASSPNHA